MAWSAPQRGPIVGGDNGIDLVVLRREDVLHDLGCRRGIPVVYPLVSDDLDLAAVDERLQDLHLAVADEDGVVVRRASAEEHEVAVVHDLDDSAGLGASDLGVVERDVGGDVRRLDEPVVGDALHPGLYRLIHRRGCRRAVFCNDDDDVHALQRHVLDLVVLQLRVMVGNLRDNLRALGCGQLCHEGLFDRPALGREVREGEADLDGPTLGGSLLLARSRRKDHAAQEQDGEQYEIRFPHKETSLN